MILTFSLLVAIAATSLHVPYGIESIAILLSILSVMFYWGLAKLFTGLAEANLNPDVNVHRMLMTFMTHFTAAAFLWLNGYQEVALVAAPWIAISAYMNVLVLLIKAQVVAIREKDDDE